MATIRVIADVREDRKVEITLPADTPLGQTELTVNIEAVRATAPSTTRTFHLSDWATKHAEDCGEQLRSDDVEGFTGRQW